MQKQINMEIILIKEIAAEEIEKNGELSKGTRIHIVEAAISGEKFSLQCRTKDYLRIYNLMNRRGENKRMESESSGDKYTIRFNFN